MTLPLFHVDAFTDRPFAGNPAAVCLLPAWREDRWLQAVAREMNLSETAFLVKQPGHFDLRWFTPTVPLRETPRRFAFFPRGGRIAGSRPWPGR